MFIIALSWLSWILIRQDRDLVTQRSRDAIEASVSEATARINSHFLENQRHLGQLLIDWSPETDDSEWVAHPNYLPDGVTIVLTDDTIFSYPETALYYYPVLESNAEVDARLLEADRLEFRERSLSGAFEILSGLSESDNDITRAGALLRLARIRGKQQNPDSALNYYSELSQISNAIVSGVPAELLGLYGKCSILEGQRAYELLGQEALHLAELLLSGKYVISKSRHGFYTQSVREWIRVSEATASAQMIHELNSLHPASEASIVLFEIREGWLTGREPAEGVRSVRIDSSLFVVQWSGLQDQFIGHLNETRALQDNLTSVFDASLLTAGIGLIITDDSSNRIYSTGIPSGNIQASRTIASAGQTWTITSFITASFEANMRNRTRTSVLLGALLLVIGVIVTATYFISRAIRSELALAKLKSDFVSAVSHEFRTPLTSMRQLTEMLASGRVTSQSRVNDYYDILGKESQRLSRLVEGLLNFGRMEAGGFRFC